MPADLLDHLEGAARSHGSVLFDDGEWTFTELWAGSGRAAAWWVRDGTGPVAMTLTADPWCLMAAVGVLRAGRDLVSVPAFVKGTSGDRYRSLLDDVVASTGIERWCGPRPAGLSAAVLSVPWSAPESAGSCPDGARGRLVQFSSGTSGAPSGIVLSLEAVAANVRALIEQLRWGGDDVGCGWLPLSHDMGLIGLLLVPWCAADPALVGGAPRLRLIGTDRFASRPTIWMSELAAVRATVTVSPDFGYRLATRLLRRARTLDLSAVRSAVCGAEPISAAGLASFEAAARPFGWSDVALRPAYGLAEATLAVTATAPSQRWRSFSVEAAALASGAVVEGSGPGFVDVVSCGAALPSMGARVAGSGVGPVEVAGPSLLTSYVDGRPGPDESGWFTTSDLGFMDGGELFVVGRSDDVLSVRGRNILATAVDSAAAAVEGVRAAAATVSAGGWQVVCERSPGAGPARDVALQVRLVSVGAAGAAPDAVVFVERGRLPRTASGKVRRNQVRFDLEASVLGPTEVFDFSR